MEIVHAQLSNYRQSPRKVRLVVDMVRGRSVSQALSTLEAMPKRAAAPLMKLIRSAASNARVQGLPEGNLVISKIEVGQGVVFRRFMPRARGSSSPIRKKSSHIKLELSPAKEKKQKPRTKKPAAVAADASAGPADN